MTAHVLQLLSPASKHGRRRVNASQSTVLKWSLLSSHRWCPILRTDFWWRLWGEMNKIWRIKKLKFYIFITKKKPEVTEAPDVSLGSLPPTSHYLCLSFSCVMLPDALQCFLSALLSLITSKWWVRESFCNNWGCISMSPDDQYKC